jgi:hypothetical protein
MLTYHAWCHYSSDLPPDLQEDLDLNCFSRSMVVQYLDAIIYWGDNTLDSATCKLHSQLHDTTEYYGDQMGHNSEMCERGLKVCAKGASKTALKHGSDKFRQSTSDRIGKMLLLNCVLDRVKRKQAQHSASSPNAVPSPTRWAHRRMQHFLLRQGRTTISHLHRHSRTNSCPLTGFESHDGQMRQQALSNPAYWRQLMK